MWQQISLLLLLAGPETGPSWRGTVNVDGMIDEPGGYHPYAATITLRLREAERSVVAGGFRVVLFSEDSRNDVRTSVHQTGGQMLCAGTGSETLPRLVIGYLETKAGRTAYHLAVPRAFGAFTCGQNQRIKRNRVIVIGDGDAEPGDIETSDTVPRMLDETNSIMKGHFESTKTRGAVRYQYKIRWSLTREPSGPSPIARARIRPTRP